MAGTRTPESGAYALLSDGGTVLVRPARPADHAGVLRLYDGMSADNRRLRFFGAGRGIGHQAADWVLAPPRPGHRALVAVHGERIVGIAEYEVTSGPTVAEISLAVADDFHHRGVGTLLVEHLGHAARQAGITAFTADTLASNHLMQRLIAVLGLTAQRRHQDGEVRVVIALRPGEQYLSAVDRRERTADVASLAPVLRPRSVAVVGEGTPPGSAGRQVLRRIREGGFTGLLYAVRQDGPALAGVARFPSAADLPRAPDLAVLAVPAAAVPAAAEECAAAGTRALVVLSSGLDAARGAALLDTCRRHGIRLVGPGCLGIAVTDDGVRLDAALTPHRPLPGGAGVAVQSGGVGIALLDGLGRLGIGVSDFVSLGDKYDVSGNDLLRFWEGDGRTAMALLHLESFGNPRVFSRTARRVARRIPVLTVDAGRSAPGRRAARDRTAAAATRTMARQALFAQAGVTATRTIAELLDTAALLHSQPPPDGARVAVVSNSGGAAVLAADACAEAGLTVPELPAGLVAELLALLPEGAAAANPVDATATVGGRALGACLDRLCGHGAVDAVLAVLAPTALATAGDDPLRALTGAAAGRRPRTLAAVLLGQAEQVRQVRRARRADGRDAAAVPSYADPLAAARALARAAERARWLARPPGDVPALPGTDPAAAHTLVEDFLAEHPGGGRLDPSRCTRLLAHYGIPHLPAVLAGSEDGAAEAVCELAGGPARAAMRAYRPGTPYGSEPGAVLPGLGCEADARAGYRALAARYGDAMTGVVVRPMASRGTRWVAGVVQDEVFGPLVLFGPGGTAAGLLADRAARLAPLTDRDAHDLVTAPRCAPLLSGDDGAGPAAAGTMERLLLRLSAMADDLPQLAETDLDPVVAGPDGVLAADVRVRVAPRRAYDPLPRGLRGAP